MSAPVAVEAPPSITPAALAGGINPPSTGVMNVIPQPVEGMNNPPPKPGSAKAAMMERLGAKAGDGSMNPKPKPAEAVAAPAAKPAEAKPAAAKPAEVKAVAPSDEEIAAAAAKPEVDDKGKAKVNPWKLVEQYKKEASLRAAEVAELRKSGIDPVARKSELTKYQEIEKRAKELEDHIRFVDYSKSEEFKTKYQQPYEKAWGNAMSELGEITIVDQSGNERPMGAPDLLQLVNMPLLKARELAEEMFGSSANDVMNHRKEIKQLFEMKSKALEEAKTSGSERIKQMQAEQQTKMTTIQKNVADVWEKANKELIADEKVAFVFKAADGDEEGSAALERGYKFVDEAFSANPMDPKLNDEQRATLVKKQAAARNRSAGFGHAMLLLKRERAAHEETRKKLAEFEGTAPQFEAGRNTGQPAPQAGRGMAGLVDRLAARAK